MGSRKGSAKAKRIAEFKAGLGGDVYKRQALYPEVISWLAAGRVQIDEETRTVHIASSN